MIVHCQDPVDPRNSYCGAIGPRSRFPADIAGPAVVTCPECKRHPAVWWPQWSYVWWQIGQAVAEREGER